MATSDFVTEGQIDSLTTNIATAVKANTTLINNHTSDATDAHDASAISVLDTGTLYTATDVEAALAEVRTVANAKTDDTAVTNHIGDASAAHAASAISYAGSTNLSATDVEAALDELDSEKASATDLSNHIGDTTDAHDASAISILDTGAVYTATNVEAALYEVKLIADAAAGGGVSINDTATNTTQTWSSSKISGEIGTAVSNLVASAPAALNTLDELAAALGDDANFATTTATALGNRLRFDAAQSLTGPQKTQAWANLQIAASTVNFASNFNTAIA